MRKLGIFTAFLLCFLLSGCTGYREIDRGYFVTAIAFSANGDNTTIFVEALSSSDVIEEKSERVVLKSSGSSAKNAFEALEKSLVKPLYFEHLGAAVFEGEAATNIDFLRQIKKINSGTYFARTSNIISLLDNDSSSGVLGYDIVNLIKKQDKKGSKIKLYNADENNLPTIDFQDGKFMLKWMD